jgi:hypothetical protein
MAHPVEKRHEQKLREMMDYIQCGEDCPCAASGFDNPCRAKDIFGSGEHLLCLEKSGAACGFQAPHNHGNVCNCPVRIYVRMELGL